MEIDKGIPIPPHMGGPGAPKSAPFHEMEIGDSVFFPTKTRERELSVRSLASAWKKRSGYSFATHVVVEGGIRGIRIWRVSPKSQLRAVG
jgi:hypothetical protein